VRGSVAAAFAVPAAILALLAGPAVARAAGAGVAAAAAAVATAPDDGGEAIPVEPGELPPPDAPLVTAVEVRVPPGIDPAEYQGLVAIHPGDRLSRRAVRRTVQRIYELGRFANVSVFSEETAEGVALTFDLEPRRSIARVTIEGTSRLPAEELAKAAGLREGEEFAADRVAAATAGVAAALARVGYEEARVRAEVGEGPAVEVRLVVEDGPPTTVEDVAFVGDPGPADLVRNAVALAPGQPLDLTRLEAELEALRRAYREARHYRARVGPAKVERLDRGKVRLVVPVHAGPAFAFRFEGHRAFATERLHELLDYDGTELLDRAMVDELAARIERTYRRAGYLDARVLSRLHRSPDGSRATIAFRVEEGRRLVVREVAFDGNARFSDEELRELAEEVLGASLGTRALVGPAEPGELDAVGLSGRSRTEVRAAGQAKPLEVYEPDAYDRVVAAIAYRYRDEGYLDVQVSAPTVEIEEATRLARVRIRVREGRRTRVATVEFAGAVAVPEVDLAAGGIRAGDPLSERRVEEKRLALRSLYERRGHLYAQVDAEIVRPAANPTAAVVRYRVREGPLVHVGRIVVQGHRRTDEAVIRDAMLVREGGVLGSAELAGSQQALMRLGLFRTVAVRPIDPDLPEPVKDLVVDVRERPVRSVEVGAGLSIADGPRSFAEFTERNILGRNLEFGARGKVNYQIFRQEVLDLPLSEGLERELDLGLRYPRIYGLPVPLGARVDVVHERDIRPAYRMNKLGGSVGLDWWHGPLGASVQYEVESNDIAPSAELEDLYGRLSKEELDLLRFPEGETLLGSLRPAVTLDLRDDPASPHRGFVAKVQADLARNLGHGELTVDFLKVQASGTGYVPLSRRTTLALSASGGKVFPLHPDSQTIAPKRFFLGGSGSIRGFSEDGLVPEDTRTDLRQQIAGCEALLYGEGCTKAARFLQDGRDVPSEGGEVFVLFRGELRFPLYGDLMGGLFADAGNLWLDPHAFDVTDLRSAAGFGLRYQTPVGPVALDLGFNLDPDEVLHEAPYSLHFSIGLF
jgi:outer membrane protein insertion porin family